MTAATDSVVVLSRALDQAGDALTAVHQDQLSLPTPCADWDVAHLVGHLVDAPVRFLQMVRGEQPDWSAPPRPAGDHWVDEFRSHADDLLHHWHQVGEEADARQVDWQTAEIAVHTWDVARATGQSRAPSAEVAERALALMSGMLTADRRGEVFGPEVTVPDDAPVQDRLAAFAGRPVSASSSAAAER